MDTFCVHGGPDGYITGIRGKVQCLPDEETTKNETDLEREGMTRGKCFLRFPTLPFIPKEPYDVIATDYDNYAVVSGAKDKSFVQVRIHFRDFFVNVSTLLNKGYAARALNFCLGSRV